MFYRCKCFLTDNYFLSKYKIHVKFINETQFWSQFGDQLRRLGCDCDSLKDEVISQINCELKRRQDLDLESEKRQNYIRDYYKPIHKEIFTLSESQLHPVFVDLVNRCKRGDQLESVLPFVETISSHKRIYRFPVFTNAFCEQFIEEIDNFNDSLMPKSRPNTMNNYGILLNELGFDSAFMTPLRENYLNPIAKVFFPDWIGDGLDSHRAFTVRYKLEEDRDLFTHFDNAEVTLNVCLGKQFDGSQLYFGQFRDQRNSGDSSVTSVDNIRGEGIFHLSQQMHGSVPICEGERHNVVIWMRSSTIRNALCPMCDSIPVLVKAKAFGDGFTQTI